MSEVYRKIHTTFWTDTFIQALELDIKLLYLHLLSNPHTRQCGIYEISFAQISFETKIPEKRVKEIIAFLSTANKIRYNESTCELALKNWVKHNDSSNANMITCANKERAKVKDKTLIEYTVSGTIGDPDYQYTEPQAKEPKTPPKDNTEALRRFDQFWTIYNKKTGTAKCREKFLKLSEEIQLKILQVLPVYVKSTIIEPQPAGAEFKPFRKNPITWLNQGCWDDEIKLKDENKDSGKPQMAF